MSKSGKLPYYAAWWEVRHHPKYQALSSSDALSLRELWDLAASRPGDLRGTLPSISDISSWLGRQYAGKNPRTLKLLERLTNLRLIDILPDGTYIIHDWADHQPSNLHSHERVKRFRENHNKTNMETNLATKSAHIHSVNNNNINHLAESVTLRPSISYSSTTVSIQICKNITDNVRINTTTILEYILQCRAIYKQSQISGKRSKLSRSRIVIPDFEAKFLEVWETWLGFPDLRHHTKITTMARDAVRDCIHAGFSISDIRQAICNHAQAWIIYKQSPDKYRKPWDWDFWDFLSRYKHRFVSLYMHDKYMDYYEIREYKPHKQDRSVASLLRDADAIIARRDAEEAADKAARAAHKLHIVK
jgi:hypothetical protein